MDYYKNCKVLLTKSLVRGCHFQQVTEFPSYLLIIAGGKKKCFPKNTGIHCLRKAVLPWAGSAESAERVLGYLGYSGVYRLLSMWGRY